MGKFLVHERVLLSVDERYLGYDYKHDSEHNDVASANHDVTLSYRF